MTLREELAARMKEVAKKATDEFYSHPRTPARAFLGVNEIDKALADECLRQMEWNKIHTNRRDPCTLAPPDWKPPANLLAAE